MTEPAMTRRVYRLLVVLPILVVLVGCQRQLIPTPNLYLDRELDPFADVPLPLRTNTADLLYATDRLPEGGAEGHTEYGYKRSRSLAFGSGCHVKAAFVFVHGYKTVPLGGSLTILPYLRARRPGSQ